MWYNLRSHGHGPCISLRMRPPRLLNQSVSHLKNLPFYCYNVEKLPTRDLVIVTGRDCWKMPHFSIGNTSSIHSILVHFPLPAILVYQSVHLSTFLRAPNRPSWSKLRQKTNLFCWVNIKSDVVKLGAALLPCLCKQLQQKLLSLCLQIFSSPWEEKFTLQHWMNAFFCARVKSRVFFFGEWSSHIQ